MSDLIAQKALELASDNVIMNSYKDFFNGKGCFLTKNSSLGGAKRKPPRFPDSAKGFSKKWMDSNWFVGSQRTYLLYIARMDKNFGVKDSDYKKLKDAYDKWNSNYYVVIYGEDARWACNLFIGEVLFMARKDSLAPSSKYYSAKQIWNAEGIFKQVDKKEVRTGDIAAFGGYHVEIVTKVTEEGWVFKDKVSFCSRSVGRGATDFGTERCNDRKVKDNNIKFLRVS